MTIGVDGATTGNMTGMVVGTMTHIVAVISVRMTSPTMIHGLGIIGVVITDRTGAAITIGTKEGITIGITSQKSEGGGWCVTPALAQVAARLSRRDGRDAGRWGECFPIAVGNWRRAEFHDAVKKHMESMCLTNPHGTKGPRSAFFGIWGTVSCLPP
jgi:hypothetical protein